MGDPRSGRELLDAAAADTDEPAASLRATPAGAHALAAAEAAFNAHCGRLLRRTAAVPASITIENMAAGPAGLYGFYPGLAGGGPEAPGPAAGGHAPAAPAPARGTSPRETAAPGVGGPAWPAGPAWAGPDSDDAAADAEDPFRDDWVWSSRPAAAGGGGGGGGGGVW